MIRPQLEEFMRRMEHNSVAIIPSAREATRSNDTHYRFRQDSDFYYVTGFEEPESIAIVRPAQDPHYTLFVRPRDPERLGDHPPAAARRHPRLADQREVLPARVRRGNHRNGRDDARRLLVSRPAGLADHDRRGADPRVSQREEESAGILLNRT